MTSIAFLGLGRMGAPMAANLARAGHDVVVWNRTLEKATAFAREHGARFAVTPAAAAESADVVISMLADDASVLEAHCGLNGSLHAGRSDQVVVDMSTVSPVTVRELATACAQRGVRFLDAPVSGSVDRAAAGSLTVMVGGEAATLDLVSALLGAMGDPIHLGEVGAGAAMKLSVNTIVHALNGAVSEALVLAERSGIPRATAYEVFTRSAIAAPFVDFRRPEFERPGELPVSFRLALAAKDVRYALDLATDVGAELPHAQRTLEILEAADLAGHGDQDETAVASYLRHR